MAMVVRYAGFSGSFSGCFFRSGTPYACGKRWKGHRVYKPIVLEDDRLDTEFRVLVIPGHTKLPTDDFQSVEKVKRVPPPRYKQMAIDVDWTQEWPAAQTFKWSAVPFPVRMGVVKRNENQGIPPGKYGNAELMKIPNFLHLTPPHVKKHCNLLRQLCTKWPEELDTDEDCRQHFPMEIITSDFLLDGPSIRDERSRKVTVTVNVDSLELDAHAKNKFISILAGRYSKKTGLATITTDSCPLRKQNLDYAQYLFAVVYMEAWVMEEWEKEMMLRDASSFVWNISQSAESLQKIVAASRDLPKDARPAFVDELEGGLEDKDQMAEKSETVRIYRDTLAKIYDEDETLEHWKDYGEMTRKLLLPAAEAV